LAVVLHSETDRIPGARNVGADVLQLMLGLIGFIVVALAASASDPIGWGYLLSADVDAVADARLEEPLLGLPPLYVLAALLAGTGVVLELADQPPLARWVGGVLVATFALGTMWDLRRRRGTLAVYIRLRRAEIGFVPKGSVIEVPKLMFLVINQPTPLVWLLTAMGLVLLAVGLFPKQMWVAVSLLPVLTVIALVIWLRHRRSQWEMLARRLRRASTRSGDRLVEYLEHALDLDPEVILVRHEADSMVARVLRDDD